MAGPSIMALGPYVFEAHGFGFTDRRRSQGTRWAEIPVAGGLNPIQWTGGDGAKEDIRGVLFPLHFGGDATLRGLYAAAEAGEVLPLVTMSGERNIHDMWVIEDIADDHSYVDASGRPLRNAYSISLRAYIGQGDAGFRPMSVLTYF